MNKAGVVTANSEIQLANFSPVMSVTAACQLVQKLLLKDTALLLYTAQCMPRQCYNTVKPVNETCRVPMCFLLHGRLHDSTS